MTFHQHGHVFFQHRKPSFLDTYFQFRGCSDLKNFKLTNISGLFRQPSRLLREPPLSTPVDQNLWAGRLNGRRMTCEVSLTIYSFCFLLPLILEKNAPQSRVGICLNQFPPPQKKTGWKNKQTKTVCAKFFTTYDTQTEGLGKNSLWIHP